MGIDIITRKLVNNRKFTWAFVKHTKNYSVCEIRDTALFKGCIVKNNGKNNRIIVSESARMCFCTICFNGDNNTVIIEANAEVNGCVFFMDDNNNMIKIGKYTTFTGKTEIIANEGTEIVIGSDCMFAYGIVLRSGDHHSILNEQRKRLNPARSIVIGDHVWIGQNAFIMKSVHIADGCVVGACSVVTKSVPIINTIVAGNPAKEIKSNVFWDRNRI